VGQAAEVDILQDRLEKSRNWIPRGPGSFTIDTSTSKLGESSMKVTGKGPGWYLVYRYLLAKGDTEYEVSFWYKTKGLSGEKPFKLNLNPGGKKIPIPDAKNSTDWTRFVGKFTPPFCERMKIQFAFMVVGSGEVWIDGLKFRELGKSSEKAEVEAVTPTLPPQPAGQNLLKNPSFEEATSEHRYPAADWDALQWSGEIPTYKYKRDTSVSHSGKACMYSECVPGTQPGAWNQYYEQADPSKTYYASVWLKGEDLANGSGLIVDGGKVNGKRPCAPVNRTFDWKKVVIQGIKPDGNRLIFTIVNRGGKLWADDGVLEEAGVPSAKVTVEKTTGIAGQNLLKNASFEEETSKPRCPVADWDPHEWTGKDIPTYKYKRDISLSHSGNASMYSECSPGTKGAWAQHYKQANPSKTYYASVWLKGEDIANSSGLIVDDGKVDGKRPLAVVGGTFDWKKVIIQGIKPNANRLIFTIVNRGGKLWADDGVLEEAVTSSGVIILENDFLQVKIQSLGGRIFSLYDKAANIEWTRQDVGSSASGMAKEVIDEADLGELSRRNYKLVKSREDGILKVIARLEVRNGAYAGLMIEKKYLLPLDTCMLRIAMHFTTTREFTFTPRTHHYLNFVPSIGRPHIMTAEAGGKKLLIECRPDLKHDFYIESPSANWFACVSPDGNGLAAVVESGGLNKFYTCTHPRYSNTFEWYYNPITITKDKGWSTNYILMLTHGIPAIGFASRDFVVSLPEKGMAITSPKALKQVSVSLEKQDREFLHKEISLKPGEAVHIGESIDEPQILLTLKSEGQTVQIENLFLPIDTYPKLSVAGGPQRYLPYQDIPECPPKMPRESVWSVFTGNYRNEGYVSPDMPTYFPIGQFTNMTKEHSPNPQIKFILDLPEQIRIIGRRFGRIPVPEKITRNRKSYNRYRMGGLAGAYKNIYGNNAFVLTTTMSPGEKTMIYFHTEWMSNGKSYAQPEQKLPVRAIHIEEARAPEKILVAFSQFGNSHESYGDLKPYHRLGINTVDGYSSGNWEHLARICKDANFRPATWVLLSRLQGLPPEARAVTISGREAEGLGQTSESLCPSYRGEGLNAAIERGKRLIDYGITFHVFDPERRDGENICFCPRCIDAFRQFLKKNYPDLTWRDPHQFMLDKSNNPEHYHAWLHFKTHQFAGLHKYYKDKMQTYMKEKGIPGQFKLFINAEGLGFKDAKERYQSRTIRTCMEDPRELARTFDYYSPMRYPAYGGQDTGRVDMLVFQDCIYNYYRYVKDSGNMKPAITLEVGFPWYGTGIPDMPAPMIEAQMLECMVSGNKGLNTYSVGQFGALDMMYFVRAMKQITPLEDFFLKAKRTDRVEDIANQTFVKGLECQGNIVLLVSEYSARPRTARVKVRIKKVANVIDMANGKTIAHLTPGENIFEVKLKGDPLIDGRRARMFFVGNK